MDEIAAGSGRTGELFPRKHADIVPDILLCGKFPTGGYLQLSAVTMTREVSILYAEAQLRDYFIDRHI